MCSTLRWPRIADKNAAELLRVFHTGFHIRTVDSYDVANATRR